MSRSLSLTVAVALFLTLIVGGAQAQAQTSTNQYLRALVRQTTNLPSGAVTKKQKAKLRRLALHALRSNRRRPCTSVRDLARFRRVLRGIRVKRSRRQSRAAQRLAALGPSSLKTTQRLLADSRTRRCGGGVRPSTRADAAPQILESDENGMRIRVQMPVMRFVEEAGGGRIWTRIELPGTDAPQAPGKPAIPVVSNQFAVPDGATVKIDPGAATSYTIGGVDLYPAQPDPVDGVTQPPNFFAGEFADKPFQVDNAAYRERGFEPEPADGGILGRSRDLLIGNLQIPAAQYNARAKELKVLKTVDVRIQFEGGPHTFSSFLQDPWESAQREFMFTLLNANVFSRVNIREIIRRCGEEMMVITNPATRAAADTFAAARRAAGIRTNVFEVGTGPGQIGATATDIQTTIRNRLNELLCIRPSYVTIMGDDDLVPTFPGINGIPSDLQYSMSNDTDELPDLAVGRILGNDQTAVGIAVRKIVAYENTPPTGPMLSRATVAAQFQDDNVDGRENRTFIQFAETVNRGLTGFGQTVDRVYEDSPVTTPAQFNDGTALPAALQMPTFAWDGDGADVTAAWNEGRYLMIHRDHGWSDGWSHPGFNTANVQALTNGANLPVLMSINCSSAAFDYDETSFVSEALVNPNGGAVAAFGDTRDSPTWHNTQIGLGFVDALQPRVLPTEGPATKQRMGNALIHGKMRLAGLSPPSGPGITGGDGSTRNELYLWHFFGDPSMQMWGGDLRTLHVDVNQFQANFRSYTGPPIPDPPPYEVTFTLPPEFAGQTVSILRDAQVVGKAAIGRDGTGVIPAAFGDGSVKPGDLTAVFEPLGGPAVFKNVAGIPAPAPPPPPPPPPVDTSLTANCPEPVDFNADATITGQLSPAFAGATVNIKYTAPDPGTGQPTGFTTERTATTDANGNWSSTVSTFDDDPNGAGNGGMWKVEASYAGDSGHNPSSAEACTFQENGG